MNGCRVILKQDATAEIAVLLCVEMVFLPYLSILGDRTTNPSDLGKNLLKFQHLSDWCQVGIGV